MKVLVSGSSGLVGTQLVPELKARGHDLALLVRSESKVGPIGRPIGWNTATGEIEVAALKAWNGPEAVVHLAGEGIANRRWSEDQKRRIYDSRVKLTRGLCEKLREVNLAPRIFISASGIGIYGNRGEDVLTEERPPGNDFLSKLAGDWENASSILRSARTRLVYLRFGMILSGEGGALSKMLPIFKLGLGGPLGSGRQWMSWVAIQDVVRVILHILENEVSGPINVVAPEPVRNREFTKTLARALHRPAFFRAPAFVLRLVLGEMADALLLTSQRAVPARLQSFPFEFRFPKLEPALQSICGR